jgi:hypothetical protein
VRRDPAREKLSLSGDSFSAFPTHFEAVPGKALSGKSDRRKMSLAFARIGPEMVYSCGETSRTT